MVKSNDPRAEYQEENDDDFDEEKKYSQSKTRQGGATKSKTPVLDNFGRDITKRTSYVIAKDGRIAFVHDEMNPEAHVSTTLAAVQKLTGK